MAARTYCVLHSRGQAGTDASGVGQVSSPLRMTMWFDTCWNREVSALRRAWDDAVHRHALCTNVLCMRCSIAGHQRLVCTARQDWSNLFEICIDNVFGQICNRICSYANLRIAFLRIRTYANITMVIFRICTQYGEIRCEDFRKQTFLHTKKCGTNIFLRTNVIRIFSYEEMRCQDLS